MSGVMCADRQIPLKSDFVVRVSSSGRANQPNGGNFISSSQIAIVDDDNYSLGGTLSNDRTKNNSVKQTTTGDIKSEISASVIQSDNEHDGEKDDKEYNGSDNVTENDSDGDVNEVNYNDVVDKVNSTNIDDEDSSDADQNSLNDDEDNDDEDDTNTKDSEEAMDIRLSAHTSTPDFQRRSSSEGQTPNLTPISIRTLTPTYSLNDRTSTVSSSPSPPSTPSVSSTPSMSSTLSRSSTSRTNSSSGETWTPSQTARPSRSRTLLSNKHRSDVQNEHTTRRTQSLNYQMKRSNSGRDFNNNSFHLAYKSHQEAEENETSSEGAITGLLHEAVYHQNIVLQASQALNIADLFAVEGKKSTSAVIEAERILLLESDRRASCLDEVKRLKESSLTEKSPHCTSTLSLTDMKLSLCGRGTGTLVNRGGKTLHLVLLANAGHGNITTTEVVSDGWSPTTDSFTIPLTDITLHTLQHDFQLSLKLLAMWTNKDSNDIHNNNNSLSNSTNTTISNNSIRHSNSMRKIKEKVLEHNINGILFNKKDQDTFDWDTNTTQSNKQPLFRKTNFKLLGATTLNLASIRSRRTRHELETPHHACTLELDIATLLAPKYDVNMNGVLTFKEDIGGLPEWKDRWCRIDENIIRYWRESIDATAKEPLGIIDLRQCIGSSVTLLPPSACARPHTIEIVVRRPSRDGDSNSLMTVVDNGVTFITYLICCGNEEKCSTWFTAINKQLGDYIAWK